MQAFFRNHLLYFILCIFCISCDNSNSEASRQHSSSSSADKATSSNASPVIQADTILQAALSSSDRKFIRTADMQFRTKDVSRTTGAIESLTIKYNGFVTDTRLTSSVLTTSTILISADSLLQRKEYEVKNTMTIRIPNNRLDTLLNEINRLADFIDFRVVKADDISMQLLENALKAKRVTNAEKRYTKAIEEKGNKLNEHIQAEEDLLALQNEADNRTLSTMAYLDKVNYSTLSLHIYQPSAFTHEKLLNQESIKPYEPSLLSRLSEAFASGWNIFEELLIFLVRIWAILLSGLIGLWIYKRIKLRSLEKI
jgi:hypothetical protein